MSPKQRFPVMFEPGQLAVMKEIERRTGAPVAEQIRRSVDTYIASQTVLSKREVKALTEA